MSVSSITMLQNVFNSFVLPLRQTLKYTSIKDILYFIYVLKIVYAIIDFKWQYQIWIFKNNILYELPQCPFYALLTALTHTDARTHTHRATNRPTDRQTHTPKYIILYWTPKETIHIFNIEYFLNISLVSLNLANIITWSTLSNATLYTLYFLP